MGSEIRIALFISNHETIKAEKYFTEGQISFRPIIPPKNIIPGCSMGLEFNSSNTDRVIGLCRKEGLCLKGIYRYSETGWHKE